MRITRFLSLVVTLLLVGPMTVSATQQTDQEAPQAELQEHLETVSVSYMQSYGDLNISEATPDTEAQQHFPFFTTSLYVFETEDDAAKGYQLIVDANSYPDVETQEIDNLGDEATTMIHGGEIPLDVSLARQGNVIIGTMATDWPDAGDLPVKVVRHILENGPSSDPLQIRDNGLATGGWTDAFPQPNTFEPFSEFEPSPVFANWGFPNSPSEVEAIATASASAPVPTVKRP